MPAEIKKTPRDIVEDQNGDTTNEISIGSEELDTIEKITYGSSKKQVPDTVKNIASR